MTSCSKDFSDEKTLENDVKPTSFSKEKQAISFQSMDVFKNFMETYQNLTFGYVNNDLSKGKYNIQSSATFTYPKIRNIDLSIETGAFYNGSWGGSKLTVIYND